MCEWALNASQVFVMELNWCFLFVLYPQFSPWNSFFLCKKSVLLLWKFMFRWTLPMPVRYAAHCLLRLLFTCAPVPRGPVSPHTRCLSWPAPWWWQAGRCPHGYTAGRRSSAWHAPPHHQGSCRYKHPHNYSAGQRLLGMLHHAIRVLSIKVLTVK